MPFWIVSRSVAVRLAGASVRPSSVQPPPSVVMSQYAVNGAIGPLPSTSTVYVPSPTEVCALCSSRHALAGRHLSEPASQIELLQSVDTPHVLPTAHLGHVPPQSRSVSLPSLRPSMQ